MIESGMVRSDAAALAIFHAEREKHEKRDEELSKAGKKDGFGFDTFSNREGYFHFAPKPLAVRAVLMGRNSIKLPAAFIIFEVDRDPKDDWYLQALEITLETIDHVLAHPKPETFRLAWSS